MTIDSGSLADPALFATFVNAGLTDLLAYLTSVPY
jgi:hypothetical protein